MKTSTKTKSDLINKIEDITEEQIIGKSFDIYPEIQSIFKDKKEHSVFSDLLDVCRYNDNALNDLITYFNDFFIREVKFENLDEETKKWCISEKWNKGNFKFTSYFRGEFMVQNYRNNELIIYNRNKNVNVLIISEFTIFLLLVFYSHVNPNDITIYVDSDFEIWLYKYFGAKEENIYKIKDWKNVGEEKFMTKHFDVVFSNPPYNIGKAKNFDMTLLRMLMKDKIADRIVFVHPTTFIFSEKFRDYYDHNYLDYVYIFNGNEEFGIDQPVASLAISVWDLNKNNDIITVQDEFRNKEIYKDHFDRVSLFGTKYDFVKNIRKKVDEFLEKNGSVLDGHNVNSDYSNIAHLNAKFNTMGGAGTNLPAKDIKANTCDETFRYGKDFTYGYCIWPFNDMNLITNFIDSFKTISIMFILYFTKNTTGLVKGRPLRIVPWFGDYSKKITDKYIVKKLGFTKEEWDYMYDFIMKSNNNQNPYPDFDNEYPEF